MKLAKFATVVIISILLISAFSSLIKVKADNIGTSTSTLNFFSTDNWNIQDDGSISITKNETIPASPLSDLYRQELGVQNSTINYAIPIPVSINETINASTGNNSTNIAGNPIPIREPYLNAISQDYLSSYGLYSVVTDSSVLPVDNLGGCQVYTSSMASPYVLGVSTDDSGQTWTIGIGPENTTQFAEYIFTQIIFMQMFLDNMSSPTIYQSSSLVNISMPDDFQLLNANDLNQNWSVNLGGGNEITASLSYTGSVVLQETMTISQQNTTIPMNDLSRAFQGFMNFNLIYTQPPEEDDDDAPVNSSQNTTNTVLTSNPEPDFSWTYDWNLVDADLGQSFDFSQMMQSNLPAESELSLDAHLQLDAVFDVSWDPTIPILGLSDFDASVTVNAELDINIAADLTAQYSKDLETPEVTLTSPTAIGFFIGPVPVEINLAVTLQGSLTVDFSAGAHFTTGYVATGYAQYGVRLNQGSNALTPYETPPQFTGHFIPPSVDVTVTAELTPALNFGISALFYDAAGPILTVSPYVDFQFSYSNGISKININGGIDFSIGFTFNSELQNLLNLDTVNFAGFDVSLFSLTWDTHYDLGITGITLSKSTLHPEDVVDVIVTVENLGTEGPESCNVNLALDGSTVIGSTQQVQNLGIGDSGSVTFSWTVPNIPNDSGNHNVIATLSNFSPPETTGDGNDYTSNDQFTLPIYISPLSIAVSFSPSSEWYTPNDPITVYATLINMRSNPVTFNTEVVFSDSQGQTYSIALPQSITLASAGTEGSSLSENVYWTIPNGAPVGEYQISFECTESASSIGRQSNQIGTTLDTNATSVDVFYVYNLNIISPTTSSPVTIGNPSSPSTFYVQLTWIPEAANNFFGGTSFSAAVGDKSASCTQITDFDSTVCGGTAYELEITPPSQASSGQYDLTITASLNGVNSGLPYCISDSATQSDAVIYSTNPSAGTIDKGLSYLQSVQQADGSWCDSVGITSLDALAFLNAGYTTSDSTVNSAINYILSNVHSDGSIWVDYSHQNYETSMAVVTLVATHDSAYQIAISNAENWIIESQWGSPSFPYGNIGMDDWRYGGFGYGEGERPDLSNTQWSLLALNAAGLPQSDPLWARAQIFLARCQNINFPVTVDAAGTSYTVTPYNQYGGYDGGFIYQPGNSLSGGETSYGSMTGAGIWGLVLAGVSDERYSSAINWVSSQYTWSSNPEMGSSGQYYYYLSMAKALTMTGLTTIDGHNWYQDLSSTLASLQNSDGSWVNSNDWVDEYIPQLATAYALLALETQNSNNAAPAVQQVSSVQYSMYSSCYLEIVDPQGNIIGYNPATGRGENDLGSRAIYSGISTEPQEIIILDPQPGTYQVNLFGNSVGEYNLTIEGTYGNEITKTLNYTGTVNPGDEQVTDVTLTSIVGPVDVYSSQPQVTATGVTLLPNTPISDPQLQVYNILDFNHTGTVNFQDIVYFVTAYIQYHQTGVLNPACDLNHDGVLDFSDITLFVQDYIAAVQNQAVNSG